jgi:diguanylate cyclase (GGDEF)-like protein/PAS domain S-box-containing protein
MDEPLDAIRHVLDRVIDGALVVGADGRVEWANRDTERIFAREREATIGMSWNDLLDRIPTDGPGPGAHTVDVLRGDGLRVSARAFVTRVGDRLVVTLQDRAGPEPPPSMPAGVDEPHAMLGSIADAVDAFLFAGEVTPGGWYVTTFHGPGIEKLLGGSIDYEDANRRYDLAVHPEDYPAYEALYDFETRTEGVPAEATYRLRGLDGRTRWVRERSVPRRIDGRLLLFGVVVDVTGELTALDEIERARSERLAAVDRYERAVALASDVMLTCDREGLVTFVNPAVEPLLGHAPDGLSGRALAGLCHPDDAELVETYLAEEFGKQVASQVVVRFVARDGRLLHISWAATYDAKDDVMFMVGRDVSDEVEARAEIERRSRTDALTDLFNRRHLVDALTAELERARREPRRPGLLLVDLDHFKLVNDSYGHPAGDAVLKEVASRLRRAVRRYDVVARWGGEEFCVLLAGVTSERALRRTAQAVCRAIGETPVEVGEQRLVKVTASVGAVLAREGMWSVEALVDSADRALYAAKRQGRDRAVLASELTVEDIVVDREPESVRLAQALVLSASAREGMPEAHVREVSDLASAIATELGLPAETVMRCRLGGWLHDLGKMALPDSVLRKPGKLDEDEWALVREHSEVGERIVRRIPGLAQAAPAIRHHHERWDGTGYPDGLAGEDIPVEARIVAVADAFSAMTHDRVHQERRPAVEALADLHREAGSRHDPRCVQALASVLDREGRVYAPVGPQHAP